MRSSLDDIRGYDGSLPHRTRLGSDPLVYITEDGGELCPECANMAEKEGLAGNPSDPQWYIIGYDIHWEGPPKICDNCYKEVESAYGIVVWFDSLEEEVPF